MIYNPIKYFRLKHQAEHQNWLTSWVTNCVKDESISFAGKVQLLSGYYDAIQKEEV